MDDTLNKRGGETANKCQYIYNGFKNVVQY